MYRSVTKKTFVFILLIVGLSFAVFLTVFVSQQRQDIRNRAASPNGVLDILFDPSVTGTPTFQKGNAYPIQMKLKNTASVQKAVNGLDVSVQLVTADFSVSANPTCGNTLSTGTPEITTQGINTFVHFICFKSGGTGSYIMEPNTEIVIGTFTLNVSANTSASSSSLTITSAEIPDVGTGNDLAMNTQPFIIQISSITITPTPTTDPAVSQTPTPTSDPNISVTPTITPLPPTITVTPIVPTPTPTCGSIPPKSKGNADGNCTIDINDYAEWQEEFSGNRTTKRADFNADTVVSLVDYEIWRRSFTGN